MTTLSPREIEVEHVELDALNPAPYNPRHMPEAVLADLERSIGEFGFVDPVIARRADGVVIGGHQRLEVARRLGLARVPVVYLDISQDKAKLLNLALNKIQGEFDQRQLAELLRELEALPDVDLSLTGFHDDEVKRLFASLEWTRYSDKQESFDLEAAAEKARQSSRVRRGELWRLGRHLLMCGDATTDDVARLTGGEGVSLVITDPPYNVDYQPERNPSGRGRKGPRKGAPLGPIEGDKMTPEQYDAFLAAAFRNFASCLPDGGAVYVCGGTSTFSAYERAFAAARLHLSSVIVWDKGSLTLTRKDYHSQYELVFYGWLHGKPHPFHGGRAQTDIWTIARENVAEYAHPTTKPVELFERAIVNSSQPGDSVLDPFLGSGAAIIAAERSGRRGLGLELDPRWCEVVLQRYEAFAGEQAVKVE